MPLMAQQSDKYSIIRSMTHGISPMKPPLTPCKPAASR